MQRQFMEATQSSHVARPSDLARHEQSEEQRLKEEQAEDQQQLEPPYGGDTGDQATMGLDPEAQRLVSEGTSAEESMRGRSSAPAQNPLVARLDVQDSSPGRRSMGKESEISAKTVVSRSDHSRVPQHDNSESELVPDYAAALSAAAGQESAPTIAPQTVMKPTDGATWWDDEQINCGSGYSYAGAGVGATNASGCAVGSAGGGIHTGVS